METMRNERGVEYVKIANPKRPGDFLWLARTAFDASIHRLFGSEPPAPPDTLGTADAPSAAVVSEDGPTGGGDPAGADAQIEAHEATDGSPESSDPAPADPSTFLDAIVRRPRRRR